MKSKKSNINILVIFIILAIIGLIIYIVLHNRNTKQNTTTRGDNSINWPWIILVPKDPSYISIGFSSVIDNNTGNIDIVKSREALVSYRLNYLIGAKNIIANNINIPDEFSSNNNVIAITNVVLPQNPVIGNIPYPGNNITLYVLNKKTGLLNSYNLSRSVTNNRINTNNLVYNIGNTILTINTMSTQLNYTIQNGDFLNNKPSIITFL
jgi:hypothetical protein